MVTSIGVVILVIPSITLSKAVVLVVASTTPASVVYTPVGESISPWITVAITSVVADLVAGVTPSIICPSFITVGISSLLLF